MEPEVDPDDATSHRETWTSPAGVLMTRCAGQPIAVSDLLRARQDARAVRDLEDSSEVAIRASVIGTCRAYDLDALVDTVLDPAAPWKVLRDGGKVVVKDRLTGGVVRDADGRAVLSVRRLVECLRDQRPDLLAAAPMEARVASGLRASTPAARPVGEVALAGALTPQEKAALAMAPGKARAPGLVTRRCDQVEKVSGGMRR